MHFDPPARVVEVVTGAVLNGGQLTALAEHLTAQPGVDKVQTTAALAPAP